MAPSESEFDTPALHTFTSIYYLFLRPVHQWREMVFESINFSYLPFLKFTYVSICDST